MLQLQKAGLYCGYKGPELSRGLSSARPSATCYTAVRQATPHRRHSSRRHGVTTNSPRLPAEKRLEQADPDRASFLTQPFPPMQNFVTDPPPPPVGHPLIAWRSCKPMPWREGPGTHRKRLKTHKKPTTHPHPPPPTPPPHPPPPGCRGGARKRLQSSRLFGVGHQALRCGAWHKLRRKVVLSVSVLVLTTCEPTPTLQQQNHFVPRGKCNVQNRSLPFPKQPRSYEAFKALGLLIGRADASAKGQPRSSQDVAKKPQNERLFGARHALRWSCAGIGKVRVWSS